MRCRSTTTISGVRVRCMLPAGHDTDKFQPGCVPITNHEHWLSVPYGKGKFRTKLLTWYVGKHDYGELQADVRGEAYRV